MEDVESLLKTTLQEVEKLLTSKAVVGDPMKVDGYTLVPMVSLFFGIGIGGGGGGGKEKERGGEGKGVGSGAGGGVRPVGVVIVGPEGAKLEPIKSGAASVADRVTEVVGRVLEKRAEKKEEGKPE